MKLSGTLETQRAILETYSARSHWDHTKLKNLAIEILDRLDNRSFVLIQPDQDGCQSTFENMSIAQLNENLYEFQQCIEGACKINCCVIKMALKGNL
jgi:ABC-type transporter Mla MlaB component